MIYEREENASVRVIFYTYKSPIHTHTSTKCALFSLYDTLNIVLHNILCFEWKKIKLIRIIFNLETFCVSLTM